MKETSHKHHTYLYEMSRIGKSIEIESVLVVLLRPGEVGGRGIWEVSANRYRVSFEGVENVLKLDCGDGYTSL